MALWTKAQRMAPVALCSLCRSSHCGIVTCPGSSWISKSRTGVGVLIVFDQEQAWSWERLLLWVLESSEATCCLQTLAKPMLMCESHSVSCWGELNIRQFIEDHQEHIRGALDALDALALQIHRIGYGSIPIDTFLVGWTSIYQLFWGSPGVQGFDHLVGIFQFLSLIHGHFSY